MPRGEHRIVGAPFATWIAEVGPDSRIRLPREIGTLIPWLKVEGGAIECVGKLGAVGGVQLEPFATHEQEVRQLAGALDTPANASESGQKWVEVARFLATAWKISISFEAGRFSIILPEPSRRALQLPELGGRVVVFGFGEILEIWDAIKWHDHVRVLAKDKAAALLEAIEDLDQR